MILICNYTYSFKCKKYIDLFQKSKIVHISPNMYLNPKYRRLVLSNRLNRNRMLISFCCLIGFENYENEYLFLISLLCRFFSFHARSKHVSQKYSQQCPSVYLSVGSKIELKVLYWHITLLLKMSQKLWTKSFYARSKHGPRRILINVPQSISLREAK